jgi:uncharacterized protein (TIGR04255 family)
MEKTLEQTLSKNALELFVLRFDLPNDSKIDFQILINEISHKFDRIEKRSQMNFQIKVTPEKPEFNTIESFDNVLINEQNRFSMTFSNNQKAFWFETKNYVDRTTYSDVIYLLMDSAKSHTLDLKSKRIGMRFINNFNCPNVKNISKIFNREFANTVAKRANHENLSRVICQEEYNYDINKVRIQYGIPNKFYPGVIRNYDLLLDIDAYDDTSQDIGEWLTVIRGLNHQAYNEFIKAIKPSFLQTLK